MIKYVRLSTISFSVSARVKNGSRYSRMNQEIAFKKFELIRSAQAMGFPANICLFKGYNRNTRKRCEIYAKLTIKTLE